MFTQAIALNIFIMLKCSIRGILSKTNMFKKIVSNLPFSPALVGQLGFYAKRLKKEEATRRLGLLFLALALVIQSFAVFQPPESANASSETDMVSGGIGNSINNFLRAYDANTKHLRDTMNYAGITRSEIASSKFSSFQAGNKLSWGFASRFSYSQGERQHAIYNANGKKVTTAYSRPLKLWGNSSMRVNAWIGHSKKMGWFAIMQSCGNLVTTTLPKPPTPEYSCDNLSATLVGDNQYRFNGRASAKNGATIKNYRLDFGDNTHKITTNPKGILHKYSNKGATYTASLSVTFNVKGKQKTATSKACKVTIVVDEPPAPKPCVLNPQLSADDENCKPCPGDETIWIFDETCMPDIKKTKTATNTSQGFINAASTIANPGDQISYSISIENTGLSPATLKLEDNIGDTLEYASLIDSGGGTLNKATKVLSWKDITLNTCNKQNRTFVAKVFDEIPATANGSSDPTSYDCVITNIYGNATSIKVACPTTKIVESVAKELPKTGPTENMIFMGVTLAIATYFYTRTRQVKREVHLIRRDVSTGTI